MPSGLGFFPSLCKRWLRFWHCPAPDNGLLVGSSTTKKQRLPPGRVPESWHGLAETHLGLKRFLDPIKGARGLNYSDWLAPGHVTW